MKSYLYEADKAVLLDIQSIPESQWSPVHPSLQVQE